MRKLVLAVVIMSFCSVMASPSLARRYQTLGPLPTDLEGFSASGVEVVVDITQELGEFPPMQGDISQGAETIDPNFFEEMQLEFSMLKPNLIRVEIGAEPVLELNEDGEQVLIEVDFSKSDRIVRSLRDAGSDICWNAASWPREFADDGYGHFPADPQVWGEYVRQVVERYNGQGERNIHYIEFWNEPSGLNRECYDAMAWAAKSVDPEVKVGGPAVLDLALGIIERLLIAKQEGVPADFISYHLYYREPWQYPIDIAKAQALLDQYPEYSEMEHLITEWGPDMAETGIYDKRFTGVYFLTSLQEMMPLWPQVRPMFFELREGWDWRGPSRDLFGRWGMLSYSNMLRKPVYNCALMWAMMASETQVAVQSSREDIRALASYDNNQMTVLVWSFPREYGGAKIHDPVIGPPVLETPVRLVIPELPFDSRGLMVQRYVVDEYHSNVNAYPGHSELAKIQEVVLARGPDDDYEELGIELEGVVGTHTAHLWVIRPAERAPVDVQANPDRYVIWPGESASVTITPRHGDNFQVKLIEPPRGIDGWIVETITDDPLTLKLTPTDPVTPGVRYFNGWVERLGWGAYGRALAEFRVASPVQVEHPVWRNDIDPGTGLTTASVEIKNLYDPPQVLVADAVWTTNDPVGIVPAYTSLRIEPHSTLEQTITLMMEPDVPPGIYTANLDLQFHGLTLAQVQTTVCQPIIAHRMTVAPTIDGDLSEWRELTPLVITGRENWGGPHGSRWDGPHDCSAKVYAGWDDTYLYFAVDVTDPTHYAPAETGAMHQWDCVHFGFDLRRDQLDPNEFIVEDDCHYVFTYTDRGVGYRQWGAQRPEGVPEDILVGAQRTESGHTLYEIAFPWEEEFAPYAGPDPGRIIGVAIYIHDYDGDPGEDYAGYMRWGRGLHWHEIRPARFGSLYLAP